jgi:uncharacterized protein YndB with AHSA1/START domain
MNPTEAIILEVALEAPPRLVWRALTEPEILARWLGETDLEAKAGCRFALRTDAKAPAPIDGEVIEADPERRLSYRWREAGAGGGQALDSVVTWILEPTADGGTRLRLVHDGFPITLRQPARAANDNGERMLAWAA